MRKRYIARRDGKDFADLFWANVFGNQLLDGVEAMKVLYDETGPLPKLFRFFCMQAEAITGNFNVAEGMLLLKVFGTEFVENCFRVVAGAFSDTNAGENVAEEMKAVHQMIDLMEQRFLEEVEVLRKRQETQEETK